MVKVLAKENKNDSKHMTKTKKARLKSLIEEATVDAYGEEEQHTGMLISIEDNVACPFQAKVIGEPVTVNELKSPKHGIGLKVVCEHKRKKYEIDITSLEFIKPKPAGFEWIEAYFEWRGMGSP